jgi:hypothetical protein
MSLKNVLIYVAILGGGYLLYKQYQVMQNKLDSTNALKDWNKQHN